jgi:nucleoside-diphosphate-sugar epimerase
VDVKRVLVTGANGFIGKSVCAELAGAGFEVRASVRHKAAAAQVRAVDDVVFVSDVGGDTCWERALNGIDVVVHLAGRVHVLKERSPDPLAEFRRVNVRGSERLARSAAASGVRRLVYLSSIGVNGRSTGKNGFTESEPPAPHNPYARSKWEAEQALKKVAASSDLEVVLVRSPLVYGPHVKANFLRLMKLADMGLPIPLRSIRNRRSLVYVGNLADALSVCLTHPAAAGETFLVNDGEDVSTPQLVRRLAHHLGRPARLIPFPAPALRAGTRLLGKAALADALLGSLVVDGSKIRRCLQWSAPYALDEGLKEAARWYREALA